MADIARECGVTKMTVSRVLSGRGGVKASTRDKILHAAERLKYEINVLAQNFNSNRSGFIGVATQFMGMLGSPYLAEIFKGFHVAVATQQTERNYALFDTGTDPFNDGEKLAKLHRQRRVDGLLVVAPHTYDGFLQTLERLHTPMVVIGETTSCQSVCSVSCNDEAGIEAMCNHLYELGHRRIAFIEGASAHVTSIRRKGAYVKFCRAKGLKNPSFFIQLGNYSMQSGRAAGRVLLQANPRPTAIIASNDLMAYGVMESARELNLQIPKDISIGGFDDLPTAAERCPSLTTVHQPVLEMGELGMKLLLQSLERGDLPVGQTVMDVSLVVRESTSLVKD